MLTEISRQALHAYIHHARKSKAAGVDYPRSGTVKDFHKRVKKFRNRMMGIDKAERKVMKLDELSDATVQRYKTKASQRLARHAKLAMHRFDKTGELNYHKQLVKRDDGLSRAKRLYGPDDRKYPSSGQLEYQEKKNAHAARQAAREQAAIDKKHKDQWIAADRAKGLYELNWQGRRQSTNVIDARPNSLSPNHRRGPKPTLAAPSATIQSPNNKLDQISGQMRDGMKKQYDNRIRSRLMNPQPMANDSTFE